MQEDEVIFLREAIRLAQEAEQKGNLPIGAVIVLDNQIIARGMNFIWQPTIELTRHAEMEALCNIPHHYRATCAGMTIFTTLEPCLMCAGAILLYRIGRLVFGSSDPNGGVSSCLYSLPPYFRQELAHIQWVGPALPVECDPLYMRVQEIEQSRSYEMR